MWAASRAEKAAEYILGNEQIILDEEETQVPELAEEVTPFWKIYFKPWTGVHGFFINN